MAFMINKLLGRAWDWGTAELEMQSAICSSVSAFSDGLRKVFDHATPAERLLMDFSTWSRGVGEWWIIPLISGRLLTEAFYNDLSDVIKDELAERDYPAELDTLIATAIRINGRLQELRRERAEAGFL